MSHSCERKQCRTKIDEHTRLTRKLYEDIASLEIDIKDKDEFVHKMVKTKNEFQTEAHLLKKKNKDLIIGNDYLVEKSEQFEVEFNKTKAHLKIYQDKLKLIEEEFDIDYDMAAKLRDTEDKLRVELAKSRKVIVIMEKKNEIS